MMIPLKKGDQFSVPDMPDNRGDIIVQGRTRRSLDWMIGESTCPRSRGLKNLLFPFFLVLFPISLLQSLNKKSLHVALNSEPPPQLLFTIP
ncbi:hypothetical protein ACN42_g8112 [Penicillium freii]|uniref:Uncharacterized protein n=1 Tax=Penicillium freii TaxID=48697 RepID=A0A101MER1_PENFR|nr:hypothetical protein ACN42_g8112 [Penicillium freii]